MPKIVDVCVDVAVIMIGPPAETPEATPAAVIVANAVFDEFHVTETGPVELSEKWPVATKV